MTFMRARIESLRQLLTLADGPGELGKVDNREPRRACMRCGAKPRRIHRSFMGVIELFFCALHQRMAEAGR